MIAQVEIYQINPKLIRNFKKAYPDLPKTDDVDAFIIADRLRFGRLPVPSNSDYTYQSLQRLTRCRFHLKEDIAREKSRFLDTLFFKFSNYKQAAPFSNIFGKTSSAVITEFYSTDQIASISLEELASFLVEKGKNHLSQPLSIAEELKKIANLSYRLPDRNYSASI
ncbi:MAG: transposase [bacterium]|nr:transposase [bacterium]